MAPRGWFIVFEGIDGSGKSTQIDLLSRKFKRKGIDFVIEREPSDGSIGKFIRGYSESGERYLSPQTEALLFTADRFEHSRRIEEYLREGVNVICDRYFHSTLAYQGASGVDFNWLKEMQRYSLKPDLVLLLDIDPDASLLRVSDRTFTVFEDRPFLRKVREFYLSIADRGEMIKIDTLKPVDEVEKEIIKRVEELLKIHF